MLNIDSIENAALKEQILGEIHLLQAQASLAEQLNDASIDQIIAYDTQGRVVSCNKTCAERWGIDKASVMGAGITEAFPVFEENPGLKRAMETALQGFKTFVPHDKDFDRYGYFEHYFIPLKNDRGEVSTILVVIHDVAHRIKAEDELKRLNRELKGKNNELTELNKEILAFAYIAGNDLKWPLRKIYSFIEIILRDEGASLTHRAKSYCRKVQSAAQKMSLLTDDIGSLSIINPETFKSEKIDLNTTLILVRKQVENQLVNKDVTIVSEDLPVIVGSKAHTEKLFHSIINNSLRYSAADRPLEIHISSRIVQGRNLDYRTAKDTPYHLIRFSDNGSGFEIKSDNTFNLYDYIVNPLPHGNIGIDLVMSKKICEMHGGFISIDSTVDKGTTVNCFFPVPLSGEL